MGLSDTQKKWALGIAVLVVLVVILAVWYRHHAEHRMRTLQKAATSDFHGWRIQHYDDNPYNGQTYRCGRCNVGYHCKGQREGCAGCCSSGECNCSKTSGHCPLSTHARTCGGGKEGFSGDLDGWPTAGTFGALADTFPYGNYADGESMFYPTYNDKPANHYWTRF